MADDEWKKASTEEKVVHKNWKARVEGYEECVKLFQRADDPKNPIYLNYLGLVKNFVTDSNEAAKEKALDAVLAYIENIPAAAKAVGDVIPGIIAKCLNGRVKTRERAIDVIMMYIEAEKHEIVCEELIKGFENKQPKIVQACIEVLRKAMNEFGSKVILIKPIIKHIPKLLEEKDKIVRDEAKLMAVEMYRWAGNAIMSQFQNIKPVLMQELEEEFKNVAESGGKARQTRFLRSQQDLKAKMEAEAEAKAMGGNENGVAGGEVAVESTEPVDPLDLIDPVDIIPKLPKDFKEKLESKKWQERKEALEALQGLLTSNPKLLMSDNYHELMNDLKKVLAKDANIVVAVLGCKCVAGIAAGLRKEFSKFVLIVLEPLVERFKEKKQNVIDAVREACDALYLSTNLEAINEALIPFLSHKTPVVRQQVALFLVKCFAMSTQTSLPKKVIKLYLPPLIKNLSEADPTVRDSASEAIGAAYKALGEKAIVPLLGDIEPAKLDKIKECAEKIVLLNSKGQPRSNAAVATTSTTTTAAAAAPLSKSSSTTSASSAPGADKKKSSAPGTKPGTSTTSTSNGVKKDDPAKKKVVKGGGGGGASASNKQPTVEKEEPDLSQETVDEKSIELFTAEVCNLLANANWKDRQQACETILNSLKRLPGDDIPTQIVVRLLNKKPGLKDSHFQVLKQKFEIILFLATEAKFSQRSTQYCVADIADKIGDVKNSQQAKETLSKISESIGLQNLIIQVLPAVFEAKNPKNQEHALLWLSQAIKEFGFTNIDLKSLIAHLKTALQNSNAAVRVAAIQLIGTLFMYVGPNIRVLFEGEKAALVEQIDNEIAKVKDQKPPAPIRFKKGSIKANGDGGSGGGGDDNNDGNEESAAQAEQDLMPRVDISNQLTEELMAQMIDKNWKERVAALEKLDTILKEAKFIVANLNDLPTHLGKRLIDSNKVIATHSLKICEKLAESMGINGKKYCASFAQGMLTCLGDSKDAIRKAAILALNAWVNNCGGLLPFIEDEAIITSFASSNPNLKAQLCAWLASVLPKSKKLPPELKAFIGPVFTCLEDRNPEVRTEAQALIEPLMAHVGVNEMLRVMQKAKPSSVTVIQPIIEKARADLSAKQPAAPVQPAPAPAASTAKSSTAKQSEQKTGSKPSATGSKSNDKINTKQADNDNEEAMPVDAKKAQAKDAKNSKPDPKASTSSKKKGEDEDLSPPIVISNKNKRIDDEKALKTLKWNFEAPRKEFVEQLKLQLETCVNRTLLTQMFHDDFKHHITALNSLQKAIDDSPEAVISNVDLILRWLTLRFFETNPTVIVKAIEFMQVLFSMLASRQHFLVDYEANAFIPYFITKLGDPKDPIRKGFRQIVKQIAQVYTPTKVFNFLISGLTSKNARQRAECLEELGQMIEAIGLQPFNPTVSLKEMAKQISDRDNSVRSAALNAITIAYQIAGDYVYKCVGKLNEKDQSMLDERIKRSAKSTPAAIPKINSATTTISQSASHNALSSLANNSNGSDDHEVANTSSGSGVNTTVNVKQSLSSLPTKRSSLIPNGSGNSLKDSIMTSKESRVSSTPKPSLQRGQTQPIISKTKGEFQLDIKDDDDDTRDIAPIKLEPHKDLDELLSQPISLPQRKITTITPSNILKDSQDCKEAIDLVITHISHQQIDISFQYLLQIDVVIKDREKKDLLQPHIDNLLKTCAVKLNVVHNVYMTSIDTKIEECYRLLKGLFMVILDVFEYDLGKFCDVKTLKELMYNLLCVMIDPKINNLQDSDQLIKANNMVTLKVLELSEQTNSFCALIRLLVDCCAHDTSNKFLELVMKCIWRQIRRLSSVDTLINQLNIPKVLAEIHAFLRLFPTDSWTNKLSDLPLRTTKTLLYHLAKARQKRIFEDLEKIENLHESEIKAYLVKLSKNNFQMKNTSAINGNSSTLSLQQNTSINNKTESKSNTSNDNIQQSNSGTPKTISDEITAIFKKISSTEYSKKGLEDLYDFKLSHPETDLTKYFKKCSEAFQKYIEDGLKRVGNERAQKENLENHSLVKSNGNGHHYHTSTSVGTSLNLYQISNNTSSALTSTDMNRNAEDIMKTITDWKSKTHLNSDQNDDDLLRTKRAPDSQSIRPEQYLDMVNNLKKKYTRSRTEPIHKIKFDDDESEQLNDLKQLDLKAKAIPNSTTSDAVTGGLTTTAIVSSSSSNTNLNVDQSSGVKASNENLYDEYRRRLELIKKIKPIK